MARKIPFRRPQGYAADVPEAFWTVSEEVFSETGFTLLGFPGNRRALGDNKEGQGVDRCPRPLSVTARSPQSTPVLLRLLLYPTHIQDPMPAVGFWLAVHSDPLAYVGAVIAHQKVPLLW